MRPLSARFPVLASLLAFALAAGVAGCAPRMVRVDGVEMPVDEAARAALEDARDKARLLPPAEAAVRFEAVARQYPDAPEADEALHEAGLAWEAAGDQVRARAIYEALARRYPGSDKAPHALGRLAALGGVAPGAVAEPRDVYDDLPADQRHPAAKAQAEAAEAAGRGLEAFKWRERALASARTAAERQAAEAALVDTVDTSLAMIEVARLADEVPESSPAAPILRFKLARIYLHLADWQNLEPTLQSFLGRWPDHRFAPEARKLLERARQRGIVAPSKVGVVLPLSGKFQAFGQQLLEGLRLAFQGSGLELVARDDKGEAVEAARVAEALVLDDHVIALVGGVLTQEAQAVALKGQELGVPTISFSRTEDVTALGEWVFRDMLTNGQMAEALAGWAVETRGIQRFGVLHPELAYGEELRDAFVKSVEERGAKVPSVGKYAQDQTSFSGVIRELVGERVEGGPGYTACREKAKAISDDRRRRTALGRCSSSLAKVAPFDALFLPDRWQSVALVSAGLAFEDVITNWCEQRDIERIEKTTGTQVRPVMLLGANLWNHPDLPARAGKYVNCSVFVDGFFAASTRPATAAFVQNFTAAQGRAPGLLEAYGYDAGRVLRAAIEGGKPATREALRASLLGVRELPSSMGPTTVTPDRELRHPLFFLTVDRGTIRETDPTQAKGAP